MFSFAMIADAATPAQPATPVKPAVPAQPATPVKPAVPAQPAAPVQSAPPAQPVVQTQPAAPTTQRTEVPAPTANGADTPQQQGNPWMQLLPFILIFVVMIFFMNRSQKKQMAKRQEMMDKITKGTGVLLNSGIYGKVVEVKEDSFMVEIAENVKIRVNKSGVASVDSPEAGKSEGK